MFHKIWDNNNQCNLALYQKMIGKIPFVARGWKSDAVSGQNLLTIDDWSAIEQMFEHLSYNGYRQIVGGIVIDRLGYQYIYMWDFIFTTLGFVTFCGLYRGWKKRGGREGYVAPLRPPQNYPPTPAVGTEFESG